MHPLGLLRCTCGPGESQGWGEQCLLHRAGPGGGAEVWSSCFSGGGSLFSHFLTFDLEGKVYREDLGRLCSPAVPLPTRGCELSACSGPGGWFWCLTFAGSHWASGACRWGGCWHGPLPRHQYRAPERHRTPRKEHLPSSSCSLAWSSSQPGLEPREVFLFNH